MTIINTNMNVYIHKNIHNLYLLQGQIYRHQPLQPRSMENILDVLTGGFVAAASTGQDAFVVRK